MVSQGSVARLSGCGQEAQVFMEAHPESNLVLDYGMTSVSKICPRLPFSGRISLGTHLWKHSVPAAGSDEAH